MADERILEPGELRRYADAIVRASLGVTRGDTIVVRGEVAHRELVVGVVESAYRAGAAVAEAWYTDPLTARAQLEHGTDEAIGSVPPWALRRLRELVKPHAALVAVNGVGEPGYLDGIPPERIALAAQRTAGQTQFYQRANLDLRSRWTGVAWPTDFWAGQVYPELPAAEGKRRLAHDILWFCRLSEEDGRGSSAWLAHVRALARRAGKLTRLELASLELRGRGTALDVRLAGGTRWIGGQEQTPYGVELAPNMPTEESFTSPHASGANGTFACTFPLSFQGRLIEGLRGELRNGRLVRLEADDEQDRDFVAAYIDSDPSGNGRRLGEVALVDSTSRIGQTGRVYYSTLLDENAAAHIAFGMGFGGARTTKPARNLNRSPVHLDVMIGSPDFEVTGVTAKGRRIALIHDGLWQI